jgi:hypothetical protein
MSLSQDQEQQLKKLDTLLEQYSEDASNDFVNEVNMQLPAAEDQKPSHDEMQRLGDLRKEILSRQKGKAIHTMVDRNDFDLPL